MDPIELKTTIRADPAAVWKALTDPSLMKQWMGEPELQIDIRTDWKAGGPIVIAGFHHGEFINSGTVLEADPFRKLIYTSLSSVSQLEDKPESYTVLEFILEPEEEQTSLFLRISNFPTESIFKHMEFYWRTTLLILQLFVESPISRSSI